MTEQMKISNAFVYSLWRRNSGQRQWVAYNRNRVNDRKGSCNFRFCRRQWKLIRGLVTEEANKKLCATCMHMYAFKMVLHHGKSSSFQYTKDEMRSARVPASFKFLSLHCERRFSKSYDDIHVGQKRMKQISQPTFIWTLKIICGLMTLSLTTQRSGKAVLQWAG